RVLLPSYSAQGRSFSASGIQAELVLPPCTNLDQSSLRQGWYTRQQSQELARSLFGSSRLPPGTYLDNRRIGPAPHMIRNTRGPNRSPRDRFQWPCPKYQVCRRDGRFAKKRLHCVALD